MSKTFYQLAIATLALNTVIQLLFTIEYTYPSLFSLTLTKLKISLIVIGGLYIVHLIFFLIYLKSHKLRSSFFFALIGGIIYTILLLALILLINKDITQDNYDLIYYSLLLSNLFFGFSVIFTKANKIKWLKIGSYSTIFFSIIFISIKITQTYFIQDLELIRVVYLFTSYSSIIIPIIYMINYYTELKKIKESDSEIIDAN